MSYFSGKIHYTSSYSLFTVQHPVKFYFFREKTTQTDHFFQRMNRQSVVTLLEILFQNRPKSIKIFILADFQSMITSLFQLTATESTEWVSFFRYYHRRYFPLCQTGIQPKKGIQILFRRIIMINKWNGTINDPTNSGSPL